MYHTVIFQFICKLTFVYTQLSYRDAKYCSLNYLFTYCILDCNEDADVIVGAYVIRPLWQLVPTLPGYEQVIGGLVNTPMSTNFRALKSDPKEEELCAALSCQCPTSKKLSWIQCSLPDCRKWYHLHCVGLLEEDEKPERWSWGLENISEQGCFR